MKRTAKRARKARKVVESAVFNVDRVEKRIVPGFGEKYWAGKDGSIWRDGCELSQQNGMYVSISWKGKCEKVKVAMLVARAWISNGAGREWVRHKDGDAKNNCVENLEWCEKREELRGRRAVSSAVSAWRKGSGELVGSFGSVKEAARVLGVDESGIRRVLRGGAKSCGGYVFKW